MVSLEETYDDLTPLPRQVVVVTVMNERSGDNLMTGTLRLRGNICYNNDWRTQQQSELEIPEILLNQAMRNRNEFVIWFETPEMFSEG